MRRVAAVVLALVLASHAPAGDAAQECRDAWAALSEWPKRDGAEPSEKHDEALERRFQAAFAAAPWDAFDDDQDGMLLDAGLRRFIADARARGDLAAARKGATTFVSRRWSGDAFEARGLTLPELELAAGDVDAALRGFRIGGRLPTPGPSFADVLRTATARLRSGDVLAACGDAAGARAEYEVFRKELRAERFSAKNFDAQTAEIEARELLGKRLPALPKCTWIGDAPVDMPNRVVVVWAGRIGCAGDAGRLRELDRLVAETGATDVRILVMPRSVGEEVSDDIDEVLGVRVPRGPDDGEGEAIDFVCKDVAGSVAKIRERLKLRVSIGVATERSPPFDKPLVLVADRSGTIVHASVAGDYTDWICGIARVVAAGKKLNATPKLRPSADEALATCTHNLAVMAANYPAYAQSQRMKTRSLVPRRRGPAIWFDLCVGMDDDAAPSEHFMLCPADDAAFVPTVKADSYLWDEADREHPPAGLCSYAGRDFVGSPPGKDDKNAVIGACLHHPGGAVVARADGTVEFVTLKDLGIASEAEKIVGPDSKSPLLRLLR